MIICFTGTGNSLYAAKQLLKDGEELVMLREGTVLPGLSDGERLGFVFPVYFYTVPAIVSRFIAQLQIPCPEYTFAVITCGGGIGQAGAVLKKQLAAVNIRLDYCTQLLMPDNAMLYYQIPEADTIEPLLDKADLELKKIAAALERRTQQLPGKVSLVSDAMGLLYGKSTRKFLVQDSCIGCGLCERSCPEQAIALRDGRPRWVKPECSKCTACINRCPVQAIQYGKATAKRRRYRNPRV